MRGTTVVDGHGTMRAACGRMLLKSRGEIQPTKHGRQSRAYSKAGTTIDQTRKATHRKDWFYRFFGLAFLIFFVKDVLLFFDFGSLNGWHEWLPFFERTLKYFVMAVTLIVVAVPEGLPMSVTLSLALNMRPWPLSTNNLVRKMHACETMGAITVICTDKTGTRLKLDASARA